MKRREKVSMKAIFIFGAGIALVIYGAFLIWPPIGLIAFGLTLVALGLARGSIDMEEG